MSEPGFREIHLSGKHVVFLFMAGAVVAVAVFLLGVSVGKGITKSEVASAQTLPTSGAAADPSPSPASDSSKPNPGDFRATLAMQGKDAPKPSETPAAPAPAATPAESPSPAPKSSPTQTPAKPAEAKPAEAKPAPDPAPAKGAYWVLVDSFASRSNANTRLAELKKKGYANSTIYNVSGAKAPFRVRVGPFPDVDAANATKARLTKEGYAPSVIR
jgi:DedD protein